MEEPEDDVMLAIAALDSLRTANDASSSKTAASIRRPNGLQLPESSVIVEQERATAGQSSLELGARYVRQPSTSKAIPYPHYANGSGTGWMSSSSATSASASSASGAIFSPPSHTPSVHTLAGSTDASSASSPSSPRFTFGEAGAESHGRTTATSSAAQSRASDRPPYSVFVHHDKRRPGIDTPGETASMISIGSHDGHPALFSENAEESSPAVTPLASDEGFIGRVSQLPIVSGALKVYERGRNSSRVVKYGAGLVETSVKTISKPVINRVVGPNLAGQLDDFACRQLDRFGPRSSNSPKPSPHMDSNQHTPIHTSEAAAVSAKDEPSDPSYFPYPETYYQHRSHGKGRASECESSTTINDAMSLSSHISDASGMDPDRYDMNGMPPPSQQQIVRSSAAARSRWQNLVIEAGVTAGGISAAVSEESMKSLKYCLHWLHYATAHLDHQVGILRDFILSLSAVRRKSLAAGGTSALSSEALAEMDDGQSVLIPNALLTSEDARAANILDGIKRDVLETIRKVVNVVSTYAGAALPEQAKRYVRNSILSLPERWAATVQVPVTSDSTEMTQAVSGSGTNADLNASTLAQAPHRPSGTQAAAERTLTFAVDSLDMLRSVLNIFNDSVDRADAWVERLRIVGLQRQQAMSANGQRGSLSLAGLEGSTRYRTHNSKAGADGISSHSTGIRRRDDTAATDEDAEMHQRRKASRTSVERSTTSSITGDRDMEIDL